MKSPESGIFLGGNYLVSKLHDVAICVAVNSPVLPMTGLFFPVP